MERDYYPLSDAYTSPSTTGLSSSDGTRSPQSVSLSLSPPQLNSSCVSGFRYCILLSRLSVNPATNMFTMPSNALFFSPSPPPFWRFYFYCSLQFQLFIYSSICFFFELNWRMSFHISFFLCYSLNWVLQCWDGATDCSWASGWVPYFSFVCMLRLSNLV